MLVTLLTASFAWHATEDAPPEGGRWISESELKEHDGSDPEKPIYLVIMRRVYDVTKGAEHYAKGKSYNVFVGKDNSRAFLGHEASRGGRPLSDVSGLTEQEMGEMNNWVSF